MDTREISALQRLKRVGDPASKTNEKLRQAVNVLAECFIEIVPSGGTSVVLPRDYAIVETDFAAPYSPRVWG